MADKPICYDLYAGLGGWSEGFLAEGYECIGFDIEAHEYWVPESNSSEGAKNNGGSWFNIGSPGQKVVNQNPVHKIQGQLGTKLLKYPGKLILRDVRSIHGSELADAAVIVASPPCQAYSYRAMPWKRAKALPPPDNTLFNECFRIQREAIEAAGHRIPLIVENVRGAQKWVGRALWNYGSFYLWGDVPALMPMTLQRGMKGSVGTVNGSGKRREQSSWDRGENLGGRKVSMNFHEHEKTGKPGRSFQSAAVDEMGLKHRDQDGYERDHPNAFGWKKPRTSSHSQKRKAASAMIAKIPFPLANWIAKAYYPASANK